MINAAATVAVADGDDDVGTIFLEVWKRQRSTLAYEWDVSSFENSEPDRPQFVGTEEKPVCTTTLLLISFIQYGLSK